MRVAFVKVEIIVADHYHQPLPGIEKEKSNSIDGVPDRILTRNNSGNKSQHRDKSK